MIMKAPRIAGYTWALYQPHLSDYTEPVSHSAFVEWTADVTFPTSDQALIWWNQGVHDAKWLTYENEYLSVSDIVDRMGYEDEFILFEISEGILPATIIAGKAAIWAPDARDWYAQLQQTQDDSY
jgi:hypothetical protein